MAHGLQSRLSMGIFLRSSSSRFSQAKAPKHKGATPALHWHLAQEGSSSQRTQEPLCQFFTDISTHWLKKASWSQVMVNIVEIFARSSKKMWPTHSVAHANWDLTPGGCQKNRKWGLQQTHIRQHTEQHYSQAQRWGKKMHMSNNGWTDKENVVQYYSAITKNKTPTWSITQINHENMMLCERSPFMHDSAWADEKFQ